MLLHIPNENPIFIDNIHAQDDESEGRGDEEDLLRKSNDSDSFPSYHLDPGIDPEGKDIWKLSVCIVFDDNLMPSSLDIARSEHNRRHIEDQFFGWLGYVKTLPRNTVYWRLQMNHIVINHTGFYTFNFSRNLYPSKDFPIR